MIIYFIFIITVGPLIDIHPIDVNVTYSSVVVLTCVASGIPAPSISWTSTSNTVEGGNGSGSGDNNLMLSPYETVLSYGVVQSELTLLDVMLSDIGQYKCIATSSVSTYKPAVSDEASLNVIGK